MKPDKRRCGGVWKRGVPLVAVVALAMAILTGCGGTATKGTTFVHSQYDFSLLKRIAVFPLDTLAQDQAAGEKVRRLVVTEILATGLVDVVEIGQVNRVLGQQNIQSLASLGPEEYKRLGAALSVQGIILGSVDSYDRVSAGGISAPEVTVSLRAIDASSGSIIWSTTTAAGGTGLAGKLFGIVPDSLSDVAQKAVREAVATLFH